VPLSLPQMPLLFPKKSLRERYIDALPSYLEALGRDSDILSPRTVHPTPRERMLIARAKEAQGSKPTQEPGPCSAGSDGQDCFWP
jgi:hypothetical protein